MNRLLSFRFALLCAAALFTPAAFAANPPPPPSSGTLVLDYSYPGADSTDNWGLTVAPSGSIYASGITFPGYRALILGSGDSGSSWSLLDDFRPPGRQVDYWDQCGGIASDPAGNLYVTGLTEDPEANLPDQWYVRRSTDAGMTWTTVDDFAVTGFGWPDDATGIAVAATGDVYVSGWTPQVWIIRKGVGGTSFSTVDNVANGYPNAIFAHSTAGIFAVGRKTVVIKNKSSYVWTVRRSTNGGATWSNVDSFQLASGLSATAMGIGADNFGNLYVVGKAHTTSRGSDVYHWLIRKSTNGGSSWSTVDDFVPGGGVQARKFAAKSNGDLYVAGVSGSYGAYHWIVRKSAGGTGAWTTIDDYQYAPGVSTEPHAIAADISGSVFIGGSGGGHWLIKKY